MRLAGVVIDHVWKTAQHIPTEIILWLRAQEEGVLLKQYDTSMEFAGAIIELFRKGILKDIGK